MIRIYVILLSFVALYSSIHAQSLPSVPHVNSQQTADFIKTDENIVVLDVRTAWEFRRGHLPDAINISYLNLGFRSRIAALDSQSIYLVHCKSGRRSARALNSLEKAGISNLIHLDGGIDA